MSTLNMHPAQTYSRLFRPWDTNAANSSSPSSSNDHQPSSPTLGVKTECYNNNNNNNNINNNNKYNDTTINNNIASSTPELPTLTTSSEIKTEEQNNNAYSGIDSDCASYSSRCSKSSSDDGLNNSTLSRDTPYSMGYSDGESPPTMVSMPAAAATDAATAYTSSAHLYAESLQHPHHPQQPQLHEHYNPHQQLQMMAAAGLPHATPNDLYYAAAAMATPLTSAAAAAAAAVAAANNSVAYGMDPYALGLMEQEYVRVVAEDAHLKAMNARKLRPKKFKCPHCEVAFSNNGQLKGHIRIHTGERPFQCDVETCGKTFTRNEELTRHKRIHTGLRPYPCSTCGKKFGRRDHLKKHMKTHAPHDRQMAPLYMSLYPYMFGF